MSTRTETRSAPAQPARDRIIREAQAAVIARMRADIAAARSTIVAKGRIEEGLACHVTQGRYGATLDMSPGMGGDGAGPSPGFHARAAIVGCVGIGVKMMAAREGLVFRSVEVTVETDFDDAALMGLSPRTAAPCETRVRIDIDTDEDPAVVRALVDRALAVDPWYLALRDAQVVRSAVFLAGDPAGEKPAG